MYMECSLDIFIFVDIPPILIFHECFVVFVIVFLKIFWSRYILLN